jgi:putative endonuclease
MQDRTFYVYIMTSKGNTVLYTGVTRDLQRRMFQHKKKLVEGFTKKYKVSKLVYYEHFDGAYEAIQREKQGRAEKEKNRVNRSVEPALEGRE